MKVLIADALPDECVEILEDAGLEVDNSPEVEGEALKEAIVDVDGIICRSGVTLSPDVLQEADKLQAICRAGVGVDNIDLAAAAKQGAVVMNTPGANTTSTAEHAFALMLGLARNIGPAYISMREGRWDKKKYKGDQLAGSTLGIIGLGRVGQTVATRARAFDMNVLGFDPYISRETVDRLGIELVDDLEEMLPEVDFLTVHVPENEETEDLIAGPEVEKMSSDASIINCARGTIVNQDAVEQAVHEGRLKGAAFDVYPEEPPEDFSFADDDRILATPHLGASTLAAQIAVAKQAANQMVDALQKGRYRNVLNVTVLPPEDLRRLKPYCTLAVKLGEAAAQLNPGRLEELDITFRGGLAEHNTDPLANYAAMGVLRHALGKSVTMISARQLAEERGMAVSTTSTSSLQEGFKSLVEVELTTDRGTCRVAGTAFADQHLRITQVESFEVEIIPEGHMLVVFGKDKPGLVGHVGQVLGRNGINIGQMAFGREEAGGKAMVALNLDEPCEDGVQDEICDSDLVERTVQVSF